jgi:hypothetical protein
MCALRDEQYRDLRAAMSWEDQGWYDGFLQLGGARAFDPQFEKAPQPPAEYHEGLRLGREARKAGYLSLRRDK